MAGINQHASRCSALPRFLEIHCFAGGKDSREQSWRRPQPLCPAGSHPITTCILVPLPQQLVQTLPAYPSVWKCTPKREFFQGHEFSLSLVLHCNKSHLVWVPPLEWPCFSTPVRHHPQLGLTSVIKMQ